MKFSLWIETEEQPLKVIDTQNITSDDQSRLGNAAIADNQALIGYHVTDNPQGVFDTIKSSKKLTATYGKSSRYAELGPGLYVSAVPHFWTNRSRGKWDFLDKLTPEQRAVLANKLKNDQSLVGQKYKDNNGADKVFKYVTDNEKEIAYRDIDHWLQSGHNPIIVMLADQPYNIKFWEPQYLKPLGINPSPSPQVLKITMHGKFVNMNGRIGNFTEIAKMIRAGYDGGFSPSGFTSNPELCIWRKECIKNIEHDKI
jgi:hypothetical protein